MQRLDLRHPGERELVIGPAALGDDRDFVFAGALERPVVLGGNVLDRRERVIPGIDNAFEEGHAVSTLFLNSSDTHTARAEFTRRRRLQLPIAARSGTAEAQVM